MRLKDLPNLITLCRIFLALVVYVLLACAAGFFAFAGDVSPSRPMLLHLALAAFVIASLTDFVDGWLARRLAASSALGAMLDPIADKIAVVAVIVGLGAIDAQLIATPGALILARELVVSGLRETGLKLPVTGLAKWKTTAQMIALGLCIAAQTWGELRSFAALTLWLAAALTLWTGAIYLRTAITARRP
jgi:CDP-diacylglycerol--glycerol-3-phosphate 3-phosphatidyltransferase